MAEVKTELLCTTKVIPAPTTMAKYPVSQLSGCGRSATAWSRAQAWTQAWTRAWTHQLGAAQSSYMVLGRGLWDQALGMASGCGYEASLVAGGQDGWGRRMWTPGGHDIYKQSGDPGQARDMGVQAGMGVRGSQG